jgi:hypothetical protein
MLQHDVSLQRGLAKARFRPGFFYVLTRDEFQKFLGFRTLKIVGSMLGLPA